MEGREIDLKQETLNGLKMRLRGPMFTPGDVGYDESRTVWNGMIDKRPAVVVRCLGTADVITCVQFAREHDLLLCLKGGGHNIAGLAAADDARLVHAGSDDNADLFWGLRGGGGNFGVVTGIDYVLHPVGPEVVGGVVAWPASAAPKVLELYRTLVEKAPPELTLTTLMRPAPPAPWLPKDMHGKPIVALLACYSGKPEEGEKAVAPIKSFGNPIGDMLVRRPYTQMQSLLDATQPKGRRNYWKSEYLPRVEPSLCEKLIDHAAKIRSPHSSIGLMHIGGALNSLNDDHSPVGNRDAHYVLNLAGSWEQAGEDRANIEWAREAWHDIKSFSTGGTYINFLTEDEGPERTKAALGKGLQRLAEVKARWDPENVFRTNRNIKPV
jgi:FAD/FMN-containing dehydrogenase